MKKLSIIFILTIVHCLNGQSQTADKIDKKNYYNFQNEGDNLNWLRSSDAIPLIIDELIKKGIPYYTISVGDLLKVNDSTRFVLTISFQKGNKKYGFLYESTHGLPLKVSDRDFLTDRKKVHYVQAESDNDNMKFMRIEVLPTNVFMLKQRCYWFHFDGNGTKYTVSKEVAQNILRQDIDDYLKNL